MASTLAKAGAVWRLGVQEAFAYRASLAVWILTSSFPLVSLALWSALAREGPIGDYGGEEFVAYFVAAFLIRQLSAAWVVLDLDRQIRTGELNPLLMRPFHPVLHHAVINLSAIPIRAVLALPIGLVVLIAAGGIRLSSDPALLALVPVAIVGAFLINFLAQLVVGCLAFWLTSASALFDVWIGLFIVLSGYSVPTSLFPVALRDTVRLLPFHAGLGFPVELLVGQLDRTEALAGLGLQALWIILLGGLAALLWRRGLRAYGAEGS